MKIFFVVIFAFFIVVSGQSINCCTEEYAIDGINCVDSVVYNNVTYYCMSTTTTCDTCQLASTTEEEHCSKCCVTSQDFCADDFVYIGTYFSAWTLVLIIFALSCFCCAIVFLSAEQSRLKEGMSFQEAYLLPIPIVSAETDLENRNYNLPLDQPTAIARPHVAIDVPIAEPTEFSPLIYRSR